jgi:opacity protein-like surface antigen
MRPLLLLLLGAVPVFCQPFSFGVKLGVPLNDFVDAVGSSQNASGFLNYATHTNRYILGAGAEVRLPFHLGIEVDALYRHYGFQSTQPNLLPGTTSTTSTTSNAFEFPILGKVRFGTKLIHPFVDAGVAFDTLQGVKQAVTTSVGVVTGSTSSPSQLLHSTTHGFVIGGGLDIKVLVIHIQPEIRYTRWGSEHFFDPSGLLHSNQNQGEFLLGIEF